MPVCIYVHVRVEDARFPRTLFRPSWFFRSFLFFHTHGKHPSTHNVIPTYRYTSTRAPTPLIKRDDNFLAVDPSFPRVIPWFGGRIHSADRRKNVVIVIVLLLVRFGEDDVPRSGRCHFGSATNLSCQSWESSMQGSLGYCGRIGGCQQSSAIVCKGIDDNDDVIITIHGRPSLNGQF